MLMSVMIMMRWKNLEKMNNIIKVSPASLVRPYSGTKTNIWTKKIK